MVDGILRLISERLFVGDENDFVQS